MIQVAVFGSVHKANQKELLAPLFDKFNRPDVTLYIEKDFASALSESGSLPHSYNVLDLRLLPQMNFAISLGGDGTFLRTAHCIGISETPVLGINMGRLGFLTELDSSDLSPLDKLFSGKYTVEERTKLQIFADEKLLGEVLNEVAILKRETGSIIQVKTFLGEDYLADYDCDGLIISTPTGSTAYSLSINGPIMMPDSPSVIINPIAPHTLNMRPLVISDKQIIRLEVESRNNTFLTVLDGETLPLDCSTPVKIQLSPNRVRVVKLGNRSWPEMLRRKLMWGASVR
ncbi:Probable inorganic polyphosphate/ATP-NAD kinase [Porphyromonas macacae]|uniref:NAD kinase n=1 Tax=Porphyromonas macacae TaxID=28115 RepID=A0A379E9J4_9PORP|nr:NAD(+)/NADH kinase [Porphyromonas macacae]SUB89346.1 Probable inorganic polyphosphate/ATP-NAD kinase [Porphyromonas macacae]